MSRFASLINYRPNLNKKKGGSSGPSGSSSSSKLPFSLRRADPTSSYPYASEVFDITGTTSSFGDVSEHSGDTPALPLPGSLPNSTSLSLPTENVASPRVDIDIDFTPADWFPSHFLNKTDSVAGPSSLGAVAEKSMVVQPPPPPPPPKDELEQDDDDEDEDGDEDDEDEDGLSTMSEDVGEDLKALGASDFLKLTESDGLLGPGSSRKGAPTPIRIPNASLHGPRVQIDRVPSRPESMFSFDGTSAVSGTTLARALIGDSFVLSHDRSSRYRSGGSVLTRSDSATLPRGEHPFSPAWTIRRSAAFTPIDPDLPPVPPMPDMPDELKRVIAESRKTKSGNSPGGATDTSDSSPVDRRISRITEVPTPISGAPPSPDVPQSGAAPDPALSDTSASPRTPLLTHPGAASPSLFPTSPGQSSNLSGSDNRSSRDIDGVLDLYNFDSPGYGGGSSFDPPTPDPRADPNRFQPAFSPITEVTEDMSPNSLRSRMTNGIPSPLSPGLGWRPGEIRILPPHPGSATSSTGGSDEQRQARTGNALAPIVIPPAPAITTSTIATQSAGPSATEDRSALQLPSRGLSRSRAGSAPSPIHVVRDSRDITSYNITVTPIVETSSAGSTPMSPNNEDAARAHQQTFPETPSAFSPTFSTADSESTSDRHSMMPAAPATAGAAINGKPGFTSLAQQVLLSRSSTTNATPQIRPGGGRPSHSRQGSRSKNRATAIFPSAAAASMLKDVLPASPEEEESPAARKTSAEGETASQADTESLATNDHVPDSASIYSIGSYGSAANVPQKRMSQSSDAHSRNSVHDSITKREAKPLPVMPMSPTESAESHYEEQPPAPVVDSASASSASLSAPSTSGSSAGSSAQPSQPVEVPVPSSLSRKTTPAPQESVVELALPSQATPEPEAEQQPSESEPELEQEVEIPAEPQQRPPFLLTPPPPPVDPRLGSPHIIPVITPARGNGELDPMHATLGSPPPYYTVMYDRDANGRDIERMTPSTGGSNGYPDAYTYTPITPALPLRDQRTLSIQSISSPNPPGTARGSRHQRPRPPLPVGPRRPTVTPTTPGPSGPRNRTGSVSSIASNMHGRRVASSAPRFQTPPVKWRGYTMEAAKWTFSSAQLQSIVSRAIRQSAEASSIRLLRLETIDTEIPEEIHRLEMQRTDVKTRYKMLSRRRGNLLATLTGLLDGTEPEDQTYALRLVENLKELSTELDQLAENLHNCDEQIAQLMSLRDVHSASALAMALRKLNSSFLKQIAVGEELKQQITTLQAERDEAWSQAVDVANEYDDLNERMEGHQSPGSSMYNKRSSRVLASKKSSIRVSKAGLRSSSRRSSVSSIGHNQQRYSSALSSATMDDIPPVPPIPRRRPDDIRTDLETRTSALSTSPSSETRALDQAQAELYSMLGIPVPDPRSSRRSHSVIYSAVSDSESSNNPLLSPPLQRRSQRRSDVSRPSSLPGSSSLSEALRGMTADRTAMLATLGMLND
ncbi:hypothetical protein HMN09_00282500 [Mycena chlorophos]|uniref:Uncharacterized protein n=1 Tax=Mycena chlorophos TaxID=658473 RepID=A0A8H6TKW4_MYCCL|nr:hypothetical protein HMN09_00282500 [Mycena chlorophos]